MYNVYNFAMFIYYNRLGPELFDLYRFGLVIYYKLDNIAT